MRWLGSAFAGALALALGFASAAAELATPETPSRLLPPPPAPVAHGQVLRVGPHRPITRPSEAAAIARNGDVVEIDAGEYPGDVAVWWQSYLTLRGVGGRPVLRALGQAAQGKAIWVLDGDDVRVENIEFAEVHVPNLNGAGIRAQGGSLTVVDCVFRDSENSILAASNPRADLVVRDSSFLRLGHPNGFAHGLYVNAWRSVTIVGSSFRDTVVGHHVKSRAAVTVVAYNRLTAGVGNPSYEVELPNGGLGFVVGNVIQQGRANDNPVIVSHGAEGDRYADSRLFVINNTIVNELGEGTFVRVATGPATIANNILIGGGAVLEGSGVLLHNLLVERDGVSPAVASAPNGGLDRGNRAARDAGLADVAAIDLRPRRDSPALGNGVDVAALLGLPLLRPEFQPGRPLGVVPRTTGGAIDVGAFAGE